VLNFNDITVVSVNGHNDGYFAVLAIKKSMAELPGSRGLLMALTRPSNLTDDIEFIPVEPMDYFQYSVFIMHCLHYHIHTEFALVVQDDGWVLNGRNWDNTWFNYDYVGGPCHAALVGNQFYTNYMWIDKPGAVQIMNGGLSLRSQKFMRTPTEHGIVYKLSQHAIFLNEDIQLGLLVRNLLEKHGVVFCPIEKALTFSFEYLGPKIHDGLDLKKVLGHHGPARKLRDNNVIAYKMNHAGALSIYREDEILSLLQGYGYTLQFEGVST
jgi:hypothetical protein